MENMVSLSCCPKILDSRRCSPPSPNSPTNSIRGIFWFGGRAEARSCVGLCYRMRRIHTSKVIMWCKYEWLSFILLKNEWNVWFIRDITHIPDVLRFWIEMWCFPLLLSGALVPSMLMTLPNPLINGIRVIVQLGGELELDPMLPLITNL